MQRIINGLYKLILIIFNSIITIPISILLFLYEIFFPLKSPLKLICPDCNATLVFSFVLKGVKIYLCTNCRGEYTIGDDYKLIKNTKGGE